MKAIRSLGMTALISACIAIQSTSAMAAPPMNPNDVSGRWIHRQHQSRLGWWWFANNSWFPYAAPVYTAGRAAVAEEVPPPEKGAGSYWYFCTSADSYYPFSTSCPEGWTVSATPQLH